MLKVDEIISQFVEGIEPGFHDFTLYCHPLVHSRLLRAASEDALSFMSLTPPFYNGSHGHGEIRVVATMDPGSWQLFENGKLMNSGVLAGES
jgi:hypothetical protein